MQDKYRFLVVVLICFTTFLTEGFSQKCPLKVSWKLPNQFIFKEIKATKPYNAGYFTPHKKGEKLFRYLMAAEYNQLSQFDFSAYSKSWEEFITLKDTIGISDSELRRSHTEFMQSNNINLYASTHVLGPQISFTFSSCTNDSLILSSIIIQTLDWSCYPGGGFAVESKWNDLVLSTKKGKKEYILENRFGFKEKGQLDLRFFTDYFFRQNGMAPLGHFILQINFNFLRRGKIETVSTGVFKLDA